MAYQTRGRDPLFDSNTQAALERRGKELLGLVLIGLGVAVALMLGSYAADDPSWLSATSEPARNLLGRTGASIAAPLYMVVGQGAWGLALLFTVWGVRFVTHRGADRAMARAVFGPIAVALMSIYASTHAPGPDWGQSFGLGGLFGDTALGAMLGLLSVDGATGLKLAALVVALATLAMLLFVLGFSLAELRAIGGWLLRGTVTVYDALMRTASVGGRGLAKGANRSVRAAGDLAEARARRRAEPDFDVVEPDGDDTRPTIWQRLSAPLPSIRRNAEPAADALPETAPEEPAPPARAPRMRQPSIVPNPRRDEPPLVASRVRIPQEDDDDASRPMPEPELVEPGPVRPPSFNSRRDAAPAARPAPKPPAAATPPRSASAAPSGDYTPPPLELLTSPDTVRRQVLDADALEENARQLESVLDDYGVKGEIVSVRPGPVVTMYELEPAPGLKASRVIGLADDIARSMSALSARVSTVPGRSVIGIELPNEHREMCVLREILSAREYGDGKHALPLALGKDIGGDPVVANLARMPHLLIAGTTGSGKSVAINTMILSLLYRLSPQECRLIMIDPKMLELSVYDGIPHLLSPVVTDPKKAVVALKWVVGEMEDRYRKMSKMGVRNIEGYNGRVRDALGRGELFSRTVQTGFDDETGDPVFETEEITPELLPFIVVVVDEMADLMMVAGKEIEACIQRLAQMARASGIHLIMATQRPSVDVITGTIKANFPTRISFSVTSKIDSRTILGEQGAEQLLGMGDMLYMAGGSKITRVHGPFCSDEEVEEIVNHLKSYGPPDYLSGVVEGPDEDKESDIDAVLGLGGEGGDDALYDQAVAIAIKDRKCSTSYIQRKLAIGYNKAARLVEQMEDAGIVSAANHVGKRDILVPEPQ
ncbi:cell division FtsK/SpoIIIE [Oceaniovalibus guishaninsula JLT2003]|uniref:DNA translocase FtsK n=1 Tax=Oceaniovalibus guishaninsula JLT2003 TaxID=1231392 RepID=K2GNP0_9RHOB|nr:DNA translocase FtsK [Oceaniovalibus guishaninsula]EKE44271.1 cell division FtsK/SpoIIIE [Oceaniovalibus guishaninsula JLT2003]